MSSNRKQLPILGRSRDIDNFWTKERISIKINATIRLTMVKLVESSRSSFNGGTFMIGIFVRDDTVDWSINAVMFRFIIPPMCADYRATPAGLLKFCLRYISVRKKCDGNFLHGSVDAIINLHRKLFKIQNTYQKYFKASARNRNPWAPPAFPSTLV